MGKGPWKLVVYIVCHILLSLLIASDTHGGHGSQSSTARLSSDEVGYVGIVVGKEGGLGSWADCDMVSHALSDTGPTKGPRRARKKVWRVSLWVMEEDDSSTAAAYCDSAGSCLGGNAEQANASEGMHAWASQLDALVVMYLGWWPEAGSGNARERMHEAAIRGACEIIKAKKGMCALLPSEGEAGLLARAWSSLRAWEVWARSAGEEQRLLEAQGEQSGASVVPIPWSVSDPVVREARAQGSKGDYSLSGVVVVAAKGLGQTAFECEEHLIAQSCGAVREAKVHLTIAVRPERALWAAVTADEGAECRGVKVRVVSFASWTELRAVLSRAHIALFPSPCAPLAAVTASLHAGLPVICTKVYPFTEAVTHNHDGLLLSPGDLPKAVSSLAGGRDPGDLFSSLRRLTAPQPGILLARQHACALHIHGRLGGLGSVFQVLSLWPGPHAMHRRTELFRSDALRRHGYTVREVTYWEHWKRMCERGAGSHGGGCEGDGGGGIHDGVYEFVVAAKPPLEALRRSRVSLGSKVPFYVWTWDLVDFEGDIDRRGWFERVLRECDMAFLNEAGREVMWYRNGGGVQYVNDGTVLVGDRGAGRRPLGVRRWEGENVVFVGGVNMSDVERVRAVKSLAVEHGIDVYGPKEQWEAVGVLAVGEVWGDEATELEVEARIAVSVSRCSDGLAMYHSDRLLRQTAGGCCVVANRFRGIELLLPKGCVAVVSGGGDWARVVGGLLNERERREEMRKMAEDVTWRRHTWEDSVRKFLFLVGLGELDVNFSALEMRRGIGASWPVEGVGGGGYCRYHSRVAHAFLARGDAADALIHFWLALEKCVTDQCIIGGASLAAVLSGQFDFAVRLHMMLSRIVKHGSNHPGNGWDKHCVAALDVVALVGRAGGWIGRAVEGNASLASIIQHHSGVRLE